MPDLFRFWALKLFAADTMGYARAILGKSARRFSERSSGRQIPRADHRIYKKLNRSNHHRTGV